MEMFRPEKALESLREYHQQIGGIGKRLIEARKVYTMAEAGLLDAEKEARERYFKDKPCKLSELSNWQKLETWAEYAAERQAYNQLRIVDTEYNITLECLNILKAAIRLMETEAKNLNYNQQ